MRNLQIAKEIAKQIGNQAFTMIGARQLAAIENGLQFRIGRNAKGVNVVRITLNAMDTYDVQFMSVRGTSVKVKAECNGYYYDMLHKAIETNTGLYTSF